MNFLNKALNLLNLSFGNTNWHETISANNRIISKINQQHTPFVDWCYGGREVLFEKVSLYVVHNLVLHGKQFLVEKGNRVNIGKFGRATASRMP